ncbi:MAG: hypothetical protein AAB335_05345, partial [candidate division NC10 bacterium]
PLLRLRQAQPRGRLRLLLHAGVNNFAHAGGFAGGYLTGMIVGHGDSQLGRGLHRTAATAAVALTALAFALAVWNAFGA